MYNILNAVWLKEVTHSRYNSANVLHEPNVFLEQEKKNRRSETRRMNARSIWYFYSLVFDCIIFEYFYSKQKWARTHTHTHTKWWNTIWLRRSMEKKFFFIVTQLRNNMIQWCDTVASIVVSCFIATFNQRLWKISFVTFELLFYTQKFGCGLLKFQIALDFILFRFAF